MEGVEHDDAALSGEGGANPITFARDLVGQFVDLDCELGSHAQAVREAGPTGN
jgi:hypothetical protein